MKSIDLYCHGYVAVPVIEACRRRGVLRLLADSTPIAADRIARELECDGVRLGVALEALQSVGWVLENANKEFRLAPRVDLRWADADLGALYARAPQELLRAGDYAQCLAERLRALLALECSPVRELELVKGAIWLPLGYALLAASPADAKRGRWGALLEQLPAPCRGAVQDWLAGASDDHDAESVDLDSWRSCAVKAALSLRSRLGELERWVFENQAWSEPGGSHQGCLDGAAGRCVARASIEQAVGVLAQPGTGQLQVRCFVDPPVSLEDPPADPTLTALAAACRCGIDTDGAVIAPLAVLSSWQAALGSWARELGGGSLALVQRHVATAAGPAHCLEEEGSFHGSWSQRLNARCPVDPDTLVSLAASVGLFSRRPALRLPRLEQFCALTLHVLEKRDYSIRHATLADLDRLCELETLCWNHSRTPRERIAERICRYPQGQLVLVHRGSVRAALYSQRIAASTLLTGQTACTVHLLHDSAGSVIQLLAVNVDPAAQNLGYGDELLEFALQLCALTSGVGQVVGVTLCRRFDARGPESFDEYIVRRGFGEDPVLAFHRAHGAVIAGSVPGYRPEDDANLHNGVLVTYDIRNRPPGKSGAQAGGPAQAESATGAQGIGQFLVEQVAGLLGTAARDIDPGRPLMEMGLDSADLLKLQLALEERLGRKLTSGFFFEHGTIERVERRVTEGTAQPAVGIAHRRASGALGTLGRSDVAVIGMACRLPGGIDTPERFWRALTEGDCVVGRYPLRRGAWPSPVDLPAIDRGGFVEDADRFDAEFFRISPAEAKVLDPQQRMLLQLAWSCLEDAGRVPERLKGSGIGVFIGASNGDYRHLIQESARDIEPHQGVGTALALLANRISYFFDWSGPSLSVDTACSSSLVALHMALQSLRGGECPTALVGGVNLICHPDLSVAYHKAGMLSTDGLCKPFDARADGYVRSEGAVVLLLKPLSNAVADGDRIHAILKGSAVNHGGMASGLTVPNPVKQAELLRTAWANAGIAPEQVSYIEAHGTGTALGDPIELEGIRAACAERISAPVCRVGSVKSNLGHLESAAGLAGVLKVILSLRAGKLPATAHYRTLNPKISLAGAGLAIADRLCEWQSDGPRTAGVSSFGSGGANGHVVLQEWSPAERRAAEAPRPLLFVLSAMTAPRLDAYARKIAEWLALTPTEGLAGILRGLQLGRTAMECRLAMLVRDRSDLQSKLQSWLQGRRQGDGVWSSTERTAGDPLRRVWNSGIGRRVIAQALAEGDFEQLGPIWTAGVDIDWSLAHGAAEREPRAWPLELPTYAFAEDSYWIDLAPASVGGGEIRHPAHPLLHHNVSDFECQRFRTKLRGKEFFLADHRIAWGSAAARAVLPAAAYLEMARAALAHSWPDGVRDAALVLEDTLWARPCIVGGPTTLEIELWRDDDDVGVPVRYEIRSGEGAECIVHCQGRGLRTGPQPDALLELDSLRQRTAAHRLDAEAVYAALAGKGLHYGPAHRSLRAINLGPTEMLATISLPLSLRATSDLFGLHPSLIDAVLQAAVLLLDRLDSTPLPHLPFALERLELTSAPDTELLAWLRVADERGGVGSHQSSAPRLDIDLCDAGGKVCARWRGYLGRRHGGGLSPVSEEELLLARPSWEDASATAPSRALPCARRYLVLDEVIGVPLQDVAGQLPDIEIVPFQEIAGEQSGARYQRFSEALFSAIQRILQAQPTTPILLQVAVARDHPSLPGGVAALLRTAALENPYIIGQLLEVPVRTAAQALSSYLVMAGRSADVRFRCGPEGLQCLRWRSQPDDNTAEPPVCFRERGIYLISGGAGGLGRLFAREILGRVPSATVVLGGRRQLTELQLQTLRDEIGALPEQLDYRCFEVGDRAAVQRAVASIEGHHGPLAGVIHAAGVITDNFIIRKPLEEYRRVSDPKVAGAINLDVATAHRDLDFFVMFSSVAAALGNVGQSDYAAANGFLDEYAGLRERWVAEGCRSGRSLSINWPLWEHGGMRMGAADQARMRAATGMRPMATALGLRAFHLGLESGGSRLLVMHGESSALRQALESRLPRAAQSVAASASQSDTVAAGDALERVLCRELSETLKLPIERVDAGAGFETFGMDSILAMALTQRLEAVLGPLPKTLFFEHRTLRELRDHLLRSHPDRVAALQCHPELAPDLRSTHPPSAGSPASSGGSTSGGSTRVRSKRRRGGQLPPAGSTPVAEPIAIIGLSGRYPGADDVQQYWRNLRDGRDSITEVPRSRWDWRDYYDEAHDGAGRHRSKWGGFIRGIDEFDPLFFNISPRDAHHIDPQERLFLQHAWMAMEDAGYSRAALQAAPEDWARQAGVYAGVMYSEYQLIGAAAPQQEARMGFAGIPASIANRVSYALDLHGPSMTLDTMCSSSLTAIHLACQDLKLGRIAVALAGGVNLTVHPHKYLMLTVGQFISTAGQCQSFGKGGDGYVPGEGVGVVMLKRLSDAVRDRDHIYAVIKGSALSHGGRTHGYTVPNPRAQATAISLALAEAKVDARHIGYLEAHGTGTKLGDPIEIAALTTVFRRFTPDSSFCLLGSVKSNIGHCESAAGIAGLTKVLLQMQHRQIAPSLHCEEPNPHIDFGASPFVVNRTLRAWERPVLEGRAVPLIAGVSSFGAGGSNAHLIVEEFRDKSRDRAAARLTAGGRSEAIPLSARTARQLEQKARDLLAFIRQRLADDSQVRSGEELLVALAHTLRVGRDAMAVRMGLTADCPDGLVASLESYLAGRPDSNVFRVPEGQARKAAGASPEEVDEWLARGDSRSLLEAWVTGSEVDWSRLDDGPDEGSVGASRLSLPSYPFARERYWISSATQPDSEPPAPRAGHVGVTAGGEAVPDGPRAQPLSPPPPRIDSTFRVAKPRISLPELVDLAEIRPATALMRNGVPLSGPGGSCEPAPESSPSGEGVFVIEMAALAQRGWLAEDLDELSAMLARAARHETLRALVIVAGADALAGGDRAAVDRLMAHGLPRSLRAFPYPIVMAVQGDALGAGFLLVTCSDFLVCGRSARLGLAAAGIVPTEAEWAFLYERFGHAAEAMACGGCAEDLRASGWSAPVVEAGKVRAHASGLAADLAGKPPLALRLLKARLLGAGRSRLVRPLVADPVVSGGAAPAATATRPGDWHGLRLVDLGQGVHRVTILAGCQAAGFGALAAELRWAFEFVAATYPRDCIVLVSELEGFLPHGGQAPDEVQLLAEVLLESPVPVIAAPSSGAQGAAWFLALCCDACIHGSAASYDCGELETNAALARQMASVLTARMGRCLAAEVLLGAQAWSGAQLQRRHQRLLLVAGKGAEIAAAFDWARAAAQLPAGFVLSLRRFRAAALRQVRDEERVSPRLTADTRIRESATAVAALDLDSPVLRATLHDDGVLEVAMEDRRAKNMFSQELVTGLRRLFATAEESPAVKVIVLTGYDGFFACGGTPETLLAIQEGRASFTDLGILDAALRCPVPVIAAMQGHGIGAGWCFGLLADIVLLSEESQYSSPYMELGFTPGAGATLILPRLLGADLGWESLLTARELRGGEIAQRRADMTALPRREVLPVALRAAHAIARSSNRSRLVMLKSALRAGEQEQVAETFRIELELHARTFVGQPQVRELIERRLGGPQAQTPARSEDRPNAEPCALAGRIARLAPDKLLALSAIMTTLRGLLARELHVSEEEIRDEAQFADLGLDSISGVTWVRKINQQYGLSIEATQVYSHPTLRDLSLHVQGLASEFAPAASESIVTPSAPAAAPQAAPVPALLGNHRIVHPGRSDGARPVAESPEAGGIAVIGMAGQFPMASDLEAYWRNICEGRDCITEIPVGRWDPGAIYQAGTPAAGKSNSRWMGCLEEYDRFDPLFFNISPAEAASMDPQQRLFLQCCWHAIEHAGYSGRSLSGTRCGVFAGCTPGDYHELAAGARLTAHGFTGSASSILAARIAYFLNLQGPCLAIDTACSSSLVAIAAACDSLIAGNSDVALAGGVCLMSGPEMHVKAAQAGMLSPDGRCFTFDHRANGFVPGEGVGVLVLKRAADALRDGDLICALIRGWGINQDGKTNGITAPSSDAQTRLQCNVYDRFGIDPRRIELIEAHGTGTQLGDPIEVAALKRTFGKYTQERAFCALGSVKSNIGHAAAAAGIAGVLKAILAVERRLLPPTIHFQTLNEHIQLDGSPFYVNDRLLPWQSSAEGPLVAVNSFGFSGTNAHLVLGAPLHPERPVTTVPVQPPSIVMVPLSARTEDRLRQKAHDLSAYLLQSDGRVPLADVCFTLQAGREPMEQRLCIVARSAADLLERLQRYLSGHSRDEGVHTGRVAQRPEGWQSLFTDPEIANALIERCVSADKLDSLAELWVRGADFDWQRLYAGSRPRRARVPLYPFARERCWLDPTPGFQGTSSIAEPVMQSVLHPVLHTNISDLSRQRFSTRFTGEEPFLRDHRMRVDDGSTRVLPGAVYLEMAREAALRAWPSVPRASAVDLHDIVWMAPLCVDTPQSLVVEVWSEAPEEELACRLLSEGTDEGTVHCQAHIRLRPAEHLPPRNPARPRGATPEDRAAAERLYERFARIGIEYGPAHRAIRELRYGDGGVLATLRLPSDARAGADAFTLHPSIIDGALQTVLALLPERNDCAAGPLVPFALDSVLVTGPCREELMVWTRVNEGATGGGGGSFDIDLFDPDGTVRAVMRGFAVRPLRQHADSDGPAVSQLEAILRRVACHELSVEEALEST